MNIEPNSNKSFVSSYLKDIGRYPLLSVDEELELASKYYGTKHSDLACKLIVSNLRLVVDVAKEYCEINDPLIVDLIQEGNIGLMKGVEKFDPNRGLRLSTYVVSWIRGEILRFLMNNFRLVRIGTTENERKLFHRLRKVRQELESNGVFPTQSELSEHLNVSESDIESMQVRLTQNGESIIDDDLLENVAYADDENDIERNEFRRILTNKLAAFEATLNDKDKQLYKFRLIAESPESLEQIGNRINVSRTWAGYSENKLKERLKRHLERELGDSLNDIFTA